MPDIREYYVDVGLRRTGKTHRLLAWLNEGSSADEPMRYLLVPTEATAEWARDLARQHFPSLNPERIISPSAVRNLRGRGGKRGIVVAVDEVRTLLSVMLGPAIQIGPVALHGVARDTTTATEDER